MPFYSDVAERPGLSASMIQSPDDLRKLPTLSKSALRAQKGRLRESRVSWSGGPQDYGRINRGSRYDHQGQSRNRLCAGSDVAKLRVVGNSDRPQTRQILGRSSYFETRAFGAFPLLTCTGTHR